MARPVARASARPPPVSTSASVQAVSTVGGQRRVGGVLRGARDTDGDAKPWRRGMKRNSDNGAVDQRVAGAVNARGKGPYVSECMDDKGLVEYLERDIICSNPNVYFDSIAGEDTDTSTPKRRHLSVPKLETITQPRNPKP